MSMTFLALFTILMASVTVATGTHESSALAYSNLGSKHLITTKKVSRDVPNADKANRKWTVQELFGSSVKLTHYYGENTEKTSPFIATTDKDRGEGYQYWGDSDVMESLAAVRSSNTLGGFNVGTAFGNLWFAIANGVTQFTSFMSNALFGDTIFCNDDSQGACINLTGIILGNGKTGVFSNLSSALYYPLIVLAMVFTGVHLMWRGIIKREFRAAFMDSLWSILALVTGIIVMTKPTLLVKAPQTMTNTLTTCLIAGLNGENCMSQSSSGSSAISSMIGTECVSSMSGVNSRDTFATGLSCGVWQSFVMKPWALAQYGVPYNELYTMNAPEGGSIWTGLGSGDGSKYCVNLKSSKSPDSANKDYIELDGGDKVCNVALYDLYLKSNAVNSDDTVGKGYMNPVSQQLKNNGGIIDTRWYNIILPMAKNDPGMLSTWSGTILNTGSGTAFIAMLSSFMAGFVISVMSIMALVYLGAGIMLTVFAPMFFLMALHPGRGRKIFLGWLETIVASILKYFASAVFAIVTLTLYASVTSQSSLWVMFIGSILITTMMFMYRKEIINLVGAANMGGQAMSNKLGEKMSKAGDKSKRYAAASVGSAIGANLAGRKKIDMVDKDGNLVYDKDGNVRTMRANRVAVYDEEKGEHVLEKDANFSTWKGFQSGLSMEARRGTGLFAQAAKQHHRIARDVDRKASSKEGEDAQRQAHMERFSNRDIYEAQQINGEDVPLMPIDNENVEMLSMTDGDILANINVLNANLEANKEDVKEEYERLEELQKFIDKGNEDLLDLEDEEEYQELQAKVDLAINESVSIMTSGTLGLNKKIDGLKMLEEFYDAEFEKYGSLTEEQQSELRQISDERAEAMALKEDILGEKDIYLKERDRRLDTLGEDRDKSILSDNYNADLDNNKGSMKITLHENHPHNEKYLNDTDQSIEESVKRMVHAGDIGNPQFKELVDELNLRKNVRRMSPEDFRKAPADYFATAQLNAINNSEVIEKYQEVLNSKDTPENNSITRLNEAELNKKVSGYSSMNADYLTSKDVDPEFFNKKLKEFSYLHSMQQSHEGRAEVEDVINKVIKDSLLWNNINSDEEDKFINQMEVTYGNHLHETETQAIDLRTIDPLGMGKDKFSGEVIDKKGSRKVKRNYGKVKEDKAPDEEKKSDGKTRSEDDPGLPIM